jgi:hypothetical protein
MTQVSTGSVLLVGRASAPTGFEGIRGMAKKLGRPVSYGSSCVRTSLHFFGVILEKESFSLDPRSKTVRVAWAPTTGCPDGATVWAT